MKCLLSGTQLSRNHITLTCNHKFNYSPLFHEVVKQKTVYNPNESLRLMMHEIKCPYCRQITPHLLPYVPIEQGINKINGVNCPKNLCLRHKQCCWSFKTGKKKGRVCGEEGFDTDYGTYCNKHWLNISSKTNKLKKDTNEVWTKDMEHIFNNHTVGQLKQILRGNNH